VAVDDEEHRAGFVVQKTLDELQEPLGCGLNRGGAGSCYEGAGQPLPREA
jgi:hypothetical protein